MPGPPQGILGIRESRGSDPRCVGPVVYSCVGLGFGTVSLTMFPGVFYIRLSVATVTQHVVCVGWMTVFYVVVSGFKERSPGSCGE